MSNWKNSSSWNRGQDVEESFSHLLKQRDPNYKKASREDQFRHIDYHTNFGTIDVKARKRVSRSNTKEQDELIWVEFLNVQGRDGWLKSAVDIIAFERAKDFLLVKRAYLLGLAQSICNLNKRVFTSKDALYAGYQRKGRKDLISIIKMKDILTLPHKIWKK